MKYTLHNIRITTDKQYYLNVLQSFADLFDEEKVLSVQYGKQDIRGGHSITIVDLNHCVPHQRFFNSKDEMLGFIQGYMISKGCQGFDGFKQYFKVI